MTTGNLALIILIVILFQVAIVAVLILFRSQRQYRELVAGSAGIQSMITTPSTKSVSMPPTPAWEGLREFIVQRRVYEDGNRAVCSFYLIPLDGKLLPTFKPGQFLTFKLPIKDVNKDELRSVVRCYSLSDTYRSDHYRISVKRTPAPASQPDVPPGVSSNFLHDHLQEGDRLLVKAPSGHFHLMEEEPLPVVLIAGGIGITPMLSIVNTVLESGINREVWLYYGVSNGAEQIMKKHLQTLAGAHDNFHLHICYSAPSKTDVEGIDYQHAGRVAIPLLRTTLKLMRYQFYVCGPKPMMESLVPGLEEWGVNSDDIYYESFGPASLIKHEKAEPKMIDMQPITVTFSRSQKSIAWDPAADSLLEFAEANNIEVESGCRAGSCGSCQTEVKDGEVDYNQEPDADIEPKHCLLCISTPKNDLVLDA